MKKKIFFFDGLTHFGAKIAQGGVITGSLNKILPKFSFFAPQFFSAQIMIMYGKVTFFWPLVAEKRPFEKLSKIAVFGPQNFKWPPRAHKSRKSKNISLP